MIDRKKLKKTLENTWIWKFYLKHKILWWTFTTVMFLILVSGTTVLVYFFIKNLNKKPIVYTTQNAKIIKITKLFPNYENSWFIKELYGNYPIDNTSTTNTKPPLTDFDKFYCLQVPFLFKNLNSEKSNTNNGSNLKFIINIHPNLLHFNSANKTDFQILSNPSQSITGSGSNCLQLTQQYDFSYTLNKLKGNNKNASFFNHIASFPNKWSLSEANEGDTNKKNNVDDSIYKNLFTFSNSIDPLSNNFSPNDISAINDSKYFINPIIGDVNTNSSNLKFLKSANFKDKTTNLNNIYLLIFNDDSNFYFFGGWAARTLNKTEENNWLCGLSFTEKKSNNGSNEDLSNIIDYSNFKD